VEELQSSQERLFSMEWGSCLLIWRFTIIDRKLCFLMMIFYARHVLPIFSRLRKWELRYSPLPCSAKAEEQDQLFPCCEQHECEFWSRHYYAWFTKKNL